MTVRSGVDAYITHLEANDLTVSNEALFKTNKKITFRDTGLYIYSSADAVLDIVSDGKVKVVSGIASTSSLFSVESTSTIPFFAVERVDGVTGTVALNLGGTWLWVNSTGSLKVHTSQPTADADGTVVGTQVA